MVLGKLALAAGGFFAYKEYQKKNAKKQCAKRSQVNNGPPMQENNYTPQNTNNTYRDYTDTYPASRIEAPPYGHHAPASSEKDIKQEYMSGGYGEKN